MFNSFLRSSILDKGLVLTWIVVQVILLIHFGVNTILEAEKYTSAAIYFAETSSLPEPKYFFYSFPIFVIYLFNQIRLGPDGVVFFQIILNGVATILLYKLTYNLTSKRQIAQIASILFIFFLPLQIWNVYLYTESIFISLTIIFTHIIFKYPPFSFKNFLIPIPVLFLLILTRPFGLLFIIPYVIYAIIFATKNFRLLLIIFSIFAIALFSYLINYAFKGGGDMDAMKPFIEEHIICFLANPNPQQLDIIITKNPLYDIGYYIYHNPIHFANLMGKRLISFFNLVRPYYSNYHNIYLIMVMLPTYIFLVYVLIRKRRELKNSIYKFFLILVVFYSVAVTFQCDDYHSRFIMPLYFIFFHLAAIGISSLSSKRKT